MVVAYRFRINYLREDEKNMFHIIVNEKYLNHKKSLKKFNGVLDVFDRAGKEYIIHKTNRKGQAREITEEVTCGKGNSIIAVGGDGTLHDVLNGFKDFENNAFGIIPLGTGNDFAEGAGIPLNAKKAAELIVSTAPAPVDFIELSSGLRSLNSVGMGIDVDVLKRAYVGKSNKKSKYLHSLIVCLLKFKSYRYSVRYNGIEEEHCGLIGAVGNGRQFGGGIKMFPEAKIDDGCLDLFVIDYLSKFKIIGAFIKLMLGKVNKIKQATAVRTKAVQFIPHEEGYTIQADGELYDGVALEARISDSKLQLYYKN